LNDTERLVAIDAIKQLRSRYLRLLDTKQWDEMVTLYTTDATLRFETEAPGMVFRGREGILEMVSTSLVDVISVHHGHMAEIEFQSPDKASGVWALEDILWFGPDSRAPGKRIHSFGHLKDIYARFGGRWLIKEVAITRLRVDQT
jgi:ketosteroid isomerase-like protein